MVVAGRPIFNGEDEASTLLTSPDVRPRTTDDDHTEERPVETRKVVSEEQELQSPEYKTNRRPGLVGESTVSQGYGREGGRFNKSVVVSEPC